MPTERTDLGTVVGVTGLGGSVSMASAAAIDFNRATLGHDPGPRQSRVSAGQEQFEDGFGVSGVMS